MSKHIGRVPQIFELGEAYEFGKENGLVIHESMKGRYAGEPHDWGLMAQMLVWAGGGPHLEIGTLFGGSAILAALTKKTYGLAGGVTCVDPLDSYYGNPIDVQSDTYVTVDTVKENADLFGVLDHLEFVTELSMPWPLGERRFTSAFIDGGHDYDTVMHDWFHCSRVVSKVIQFDNYDARHCQIAQVVKFALGNPLWTLLHASGITAILGRAGLIWPEWEWREDKNAG